MLALGLLLGTGCRASDSNVPDVLARRSGLHLAPMSKPAQTYARNCQGCHGEAGFSVNEIPRLAGRIGYFARSPEGRAYLVQVPNVALNLSSDETIANLMNWVLASFSRAQLPEDFQPFTAQEVGRLRKVRIDVKSRRDEIVAQLVRSNRLASREVLQNPQTSLY